MIGSFSDMGMTAAVAILIGLVLLLVVFSGRLSPRLRNWIVGLAFGAALAAFAWGGWRAALEGDWFRSTFFIIVVVMVAWRSLWTYRRWSVRHDRGEGRWPTS